MYVMRLPCCRHHATERKYYTTACTKFVLCLLSLRWTVHGSRLNRDAQLSISHQALITQAWQDVQLGFAAMA